MNIKASFRSNSRSGRGRIAKKSLQNKTHIKARMSVVIRGIKEHTHTVTYDLYNSAETDKRHFGKLPHVNKE